MKLWLIGNFRNFRNQNSSHWLQWKFPKKKRKDWNWRKAKTKIKCTLRTILAVFYQNFFFLIAISSTVSLDCRKGIHPWPSFKRVVWGYHWVPNKSFESSTILIRSIIIANLFFLKMFHLQNLFYQEKTKTSFD